MKKTKNISEMYFKFIYKSFFVALDLLLSWAFLNPEIDNVYTHTRMRDMGKP